MSDHLLQYSVTIKLKDPKLKQECSLKMDFRGYILSKGFNRKFYIINTSYT